MGRLHGSAHGAARRAPGRQAAPAGTPPVLEPHDIPSRVAGPVARRRRGFAPPPAPMTAITARPVPIRLPQGGEPHLADTRRDSTMIGELLWRRRRRGRQARARADRPQQTSGSRGTGRCPAHLSAAGRPRGITDGSGQRMAYLSSRGTGLTCPEGHLAPRLAIPPAASPTDQPADCRGAWGRSARDAAGNRPLHMATSPWAGEPSPKPRSIRGRNRRSWTGWRGCPSSCSAWRSPGSGAPTCGPNTLGRACRRR